MTTILTAGAVLPRVDGGCICLTTYTVPVATADTARVDRIQHRTIVAFVLISFIIKQNADCHLESRQQLTQCHMYSDPERLFR